MVVCFWSPGSCNQWCGSPTSSRRSYHPSWTEIFSMTIGQRSSLGIELRMSICSGWTATPMRKERCKVNHEKNFCFIPNGSWFRSCTSSTSSSGHSLPSLKHTSTYRSTVAIHLSIVSTHEVLLSLLAAAGGNGPLFTCYVATLKCMNGGPICHGWLLLIYPSCSLAHSLSLEFVSLCERRMIYAKMIAFCRWVESNRAQT